MFAGFPHHRNHYEILGLYQSASYSQIKAAYCKILHKNDPEVIRLLGPFGRSRSETILEEAGTAWAVLSDPVKRATYDKAIGKFGSAKVSRGPTANGQPPNRPSFDPRWLSATVFEQPKTDDDGGRAHPQNQYRDSSGSSEPSSESANASPASSDADAAEPPSYKEAAYRYMKSETGTVIDISISKWRLQLNLPSRFHFLNDVTELSLSNAHDQDAVSFEIGLAPDPTSREAYDPTINELTIKVVSLPQTMRISRLTTLFKQVASTKSTLTLSLAAEPCFPAQSCFPWEFGFDFDLNRGFWLGRSGTCLMFSREKYEARWVETYTGPDSPTFILKIDGELRADTFEHLGWKRLMLMRYGDVTMWRLAAVGCRAGGV